MRCGYRQSIRCVTSGRTALVETVKLTYYGQKNGCRCVAFDGKRSADTFYKKEIIMKKILVLACVIIMLGGVIFSMTACSNNWSFANIFSGRMEEKITDIGENVSGIEIMTDTADISLLASDDGNCKVVAYDKKNITYSASVEGGVLKISLMDGRKWFERLFDFRTPTLTVYLPKGEYSVLCIDESTGNITIPSDFSFASIDITHSTGNVFLGASAIGEVKINGSTGDVNIEGITCGSLEVSYSTGKVTMNNVTASGDITTNGSTGDMQLCNLIYKNLTSLGDTGNVEATNLCGAENTTFERSTGRVSITNAVCKGNITTKTSTGKTEIIGAECADLDLVVTTGKSILSDINCATLTTAGDTGDVNLVNVIASGKFDIKRDTGDVDFDGCDAAEIYVKTDTGDVEGTLLTEKIFIVNTDTGRVNVPESTTGGKCKITTDTGNVKISFKK